MSQLCVLIPALAELPLSARGGKKFQLDPLGEKICNCTAHSGAKKAHDWAVDQIADHFRTTHEVKPQQVARSRGQRCGDIELAAYFAKCGGSGAFGARPPHRTPTLRK